MVFVQQLFQCLFTLYHLTMLVLATIDHARIDMDGKPHRRMYIRTVIRLKTIDEI